MNMQPDYNEKRFKIVKLLAFAILVAAPVLYLVIALVLDNKGIEAKAGNDILMYILLIVGMTTPPIISLVVGRYPNMAGARPSAASGPSADRYVSVCVAKFAAVEASFIYGMICFLMTGEIVNMLWFYPIGALWAAVYWPRREKFMQFLERLEKQ